MIIVEVIPQAFSSDVASAWIIQVLNEIFGWLRQRKPQNV
jgi:hypothetical protein